jgi:mono/diheme cytochrome c family protein
MTTIQPDGGKTGHKASEISILYALPELTVRGEKRYQYTDSQCSVATCVSRWVQSVKRGYVSRKIVRTDNPMRRFPSSFASALLILSTLQPLHAQTLNANAASQDFFENKIRPIFANNCYSCHTNSQLGGLRLDSLEAMLKGGKRGPALVPGDAEKTLFLKAVSQTDPNLKMPPSGKLKDTEIADLTAWVKAGATWPKTLAPVTSKDANGKYQIAEASRKFWSIQPLKQVQPPAVKDPKWAKTEIDRFVLARLEKENLKPVRPANKHDLLRRATFDLIGLPPTPEEIEAFDKDSSPDAFAKVVDRLLASPHYGERWGRVWLDVARYGEDDYRSLDPMRRGYNPYPNAYMYRDWVIQAINDDMPYDQFVKAQIAGDMMDEKTRYRTLPATGFLGLGPWYYDNGAVEVTRADERHDRVDVVTRGFLGLTVACARCHDHKYDPIPTADYYSLAGVFVNTAYEEYPRAPKSVLDEYNKVEAQLDLKQKMLQEMQSNLSAALSRSLAFQTSNYLQGVFEVAGSQKKDMPTVVDARKLDFELLDRWIKYMEKPTDKYKNKEPWQAMMKEAAKKPGGPEATKEAKKLADKFQDEVVAVMLARNDLDDENKVIADKAMDGTKKKKRTNKPSDFVTNDDFCPGCGLRLKNMPEADTNFWTEIFQRELRDSDDPVAMMAAGIRNAKPGVLLFRGWGLETRVGGLEQAQLNSVKNDIEEARKKIEPKYPYLHGVKDSENPINLPVSIRGNPYTLGKEEPRHFLSLLSQSDPKPFTQGSGRLELAEAIVKEPIAMRVIVNRIWKGHFGTGIVDSPSNFGITGERPTNPELLEYLASNFVKNGMSIKKLSREILLSQVYQLSTDNDEADYAKDSGNRYYWRANRKRMEAEQVRDSVLMVAGNLDDSLGGPSEDLTPAFLRRTVYGKVSRFRLDEYLQLFDFPSPNISAEKRFTTTVPLQRLFLMNSDFMQVEAEALAKRVATEPDNRARIKKVYQIVYGRAPSEEEIKLGIEYLHTEPLQEYEENKNKPKEDGPGGGRRGKGPANVLVSSAAPDKSAMPVPDATGQTPPADGAPAAMGMGMMAGMGDVMGGRRGPGKPGAEPVKYEPTAWGRYAKVLLSASEFIFIN